MPQITRVTGKFPVFPDHWLGLAAFADVPKLATQACIDFMHREYDSKHEVAKMMLGEDFPEPVVFPDVVIKDGHTVEVEGHKLRFMDLGPGESDADGAWVIDIDGQKNAFIGDSVMNHTHGFFGDGHVYEWLALLDRLEVELPEAKLHIGHGVTPAGKDAIEFQKAYIKHFMKTLKAIGPSVPNDDALRARLVAWQQEFLPGDEFLFLTTFELERGVNRIRAAMATHREPQPA